TPHAGEDPNIAIEALDRLALAGRAADAARLLARLGHRLLEAGFTGAVDRSLAACKRAGTDLAELGLLEGELLNKTGRHSEARTLLGESPGGPRSSVALAVA